MAQTQQIFTVSALNASVRQLLESSMGVIWLVGEISNFSAPSSGHWYFTLKDSQSQVKCAMFRGNSRLVSFGPANGNQVLVRARVSLYEPRGDFQVIVESMQPEGDGLLKQQFEQLKTQLAGEGLFATQHKKPLPPHPKTIGIITSSTGAALWDMLQVLNRRDPSLAVVIYPTQVQGKLAAEHIANSIAIANLRRECDVLIVGRGGGSLEDLWCFNQEQLARAIFASTLPVISAVGHEVDVTISDYVADVRAPTPSAAAELVSQDQSYKMQQLMIKRGLLARSMEKNVTNWQAELIAIEHRLSLAHPRHKLMQQAQRFDELANRLQQAMSAELQSGKAALERQQHQLARLSPSWQLKQQTGQLNLAVQRLKEQMQQRVNQQQFALELKMETLHAVSPLATLNRGYSITRDQQHQLIRSSKDTYPNQRLTTVVADGEIHSIVVARHDNQ